MFARKKKVVEYVEAVKAPAVVLRNISARAQFRYKKIQYSRLFEEFKPVRRLFAGNDFYKLVAEPFYADAAYFIQ